ncbi:MAG: pectate lyase [Bacteroidota bacterium]|nr:pectate lyase [Bacteroidota bacterium]
MKTKVTVFIIALMMAGFGMLNAQQLAFPGAEGFGRFATGGRGGKVIEVTNLNDDGAGSLREALKASGPRIIVFKVSGIIELKSKLSITNGDVTIAGQTAPGDGICLKNYQMNGRPGVRNVIIRYMRFRPGDGSHASAIYGLNLENVSNVIVDHCSMSWSIEESATFYDVHNITVQWCIVSESLNGSFNGKGDHGYGGVWGGINGSYHHNLLAHHSSRNPRFNGARAHDTIGLAFVDFRNNVMYNWSENSSYGGEFGHQNMINNYYKPGPASPSDARRHRIVEPYDTITAGKPLSKWYINGNVMEGSASVTQNNWKDGIQPKHKGMPPLLFKTDKPFDAAPIKTQSATEAYTAVLANAGATLPHRDPIDTRIVNEVKNGTFTYGHKGIIDSQTQVGGWPEYKSTEAPVDSDHDGMPDVWEVKHGLNPNDLSDASGDYNHDGYSNIEKYINSL